MAARKYVYAVSWGLLYKFTERNWRNFCKVSALQSADPAHYGELVSKVHNITEWTPDEYREASI